MFKYLYTILICFNLLVASNLNDKVNEDWENNYVDYEIKNNIIKYVTVYSQETFSKKFNSENGIIRQSRRTQVDIPIDKYNIFDYISSVYPRNHNIMYKKLINTLKDIKENEFNITEIEFYNLVYENGIYDETVEKINDLAYYYEQVTNPNMNLLIKVYTDIILLYPKRTVAYLNIADAYWGDNNKDKAIENYKIYIHQMKENGKENKIPKRVFERINIKDIKKNTISKEIQIEKQYLFDNPNKESKTKMYLLKNDEVEILEEKDNWYYILYKGKKDIKAWIPKGAVE